MPVYLYNARDRTGKPVKGKIEASNIDAAGNQIDNSGYIPISIKEQISCSTAQINIDFTDFFGGKVKPEDIIMFTFQIATLIGAGIPLLTGMKSIAEQTKNIKLKNTLIHSSREIESGSTLSESLSNHPGVFSEIYVNMVRAGEASGTLQEFFLRIGEMIEHESETRKKIETALRYPKMVIFALLLAFFIVVTFVVPRFVDIFKQFKVALPLPTRILIGFNTIIQEYWGFLLFGVFFAIILFKYIIKTTRGRYYWHHLQLKLPIFGPLILKSALSRFTHMMGTLNMSGLSILENLQITATSIGNDIISEAIKKIRESVHEGRGLAEPMKNIKFFTPLVIQMVSVGETSGELDDVLLKVSRYYDMEVENGTKHMTSYLEPMLTLVIGIMVLFFALAIFMPMWDLTKIARG